MRISGTDEGNDTVGVDIGVVVAEEE